MYAVSRKLINAHRNYDKKLAVLLVENIEKNYTRQVI